MEHKIGEIFKVGGEWYQCVVGYSCDNCVFNEINCDDVVGSIGYCYAHGRKDNKSVIFKKLEKVGEPFAYTFTTDKIYNILIQQYKVNYDEIVPFVIDHFFIFNYQTNTIAIEIKQKEDMEEKKLNLTPFDLEAAKSGKPVCTRDGRKARIICFDAKCADTPIVALVSRDDGEILLRHYRDGKLSDDKDSDADLMMLPEKKEGWVNVYKDDDNNYRSTIYTNEKVALSRKGSDCITTIKIEWEE